MGLITKSAGILIGTIESGMSMNPTVKLTINALQKQT